MFLEINLFLQIRKNSIKLYFSLVIQMASFIKHFYSSDHTNNNSLLHQSNDTQDLKLKMQQLQQQIDSLQKLKSKTNHSSHKPPKSRQSSNIIKSSNPQQPIDTSVQPLKLGNIKSDKVTELITQIHVKSSARSRRKLSIQHSVPTERQTINTIKQTLEKLDVSSGRKKKKAGVNVYELKGLKHNVDSNIFNVTIAEIMTEEHEKYEMIKEIKRLKDKLKDLQQKKIQNEQQKQFQHEKQQYHHEQQQQEDNPRAFLQTQQRRRVISNIDLPFQTSTARKGQTLAAGRIYSRSRAIVSFRDNSNHNHDQSSLNNSRITDEMISTHRHSIQLRRNSNPLTWNPEVSMAYKQKPGEIRTHRTINHRISNSININKRSVDFNLQNNPTSRNKPFFKVGNKTQIIKQFDRQSSVEFPQSSAQSSKLKANSKQTQRSMALVAELKIKAMKNNQSLPDDFIPDFRQTINQKLLSVNLPPQPSQYETQSQLEALGQILFALFDIYVEQEIIKKSTEYKVTKYKNCVLYRLNEQKNIVWYYDGRFYFGGWQINLIGQGKKEGFGLEIIPNQYTYQGNFANNKRQGYGIMFNYYRAQQHKNVIYEGYWNQGLKQGKGYQAQPDLQYLGDFEAGLQTGNCKIKTQNTFYQGQIRESIKQGKGHQILKNGDQYHGNFKENMFHGLGQYKWKSGAYFYGNFIKGIRKGQGIWISNLNTEDSDIYKGSYEQNKKNGFGVYQWANGTIYEGYFKNDLRHDEGLMKYPNGKAAKFMWRDGNKASKLYSKQEEEYRCNRNSAIKIIPQAQSDEENERSQQKFQNTLRKSIMIELSGNADLRLFMMRN